MALNSNAIVDVAELMAYLGRPVDIQDDDRNRVEMLINSSSQAIRDYIRRHICPTKSSDSEIFTGDDTIEYDVKGLNISDGDNLTLYYWSGTAWVEMTTASYPRTYDSSERRIWFTNGQTFWRPSKVMRNNFKLVYNHGYKRSSVPPPLKQACMALAQRAILRAEGREGLSSASGLDTTTTYDNRAWPDHIKSLLAPYRRATFGRD